MKFGIIAEGWGDFAVLENILLGLGLIETRRDARPLRPELATDETQRAGMKPEEFSNWTWVKKECLSRSKFQEFLVDGNVQAEERKIIVQIDTAECGLAGYEVERPEKDENYCQALRQNTIAKISEWLDARFLDDTFFAVAIEETEAWIHALYEKKDTSAHVNAKETFRKMLAKKGIKVKANNEYDRASALSEGFRKIRTKNKSCIDCNPSLQLFIESLPLANSLEENS